MGFNYIEALLFIANDGTEYYKEFFIAEDLNPGSKIKLNDGSEVDEISYHRIGIDIHQKNSDVYNYKYYIARSFDYDSYVVDCENKRRKAVIDDYYRPLYFVAIAKRPEEYSYNVCVSDEIRMSDNYPQIYEAIKTAQSEKQYRNIATYFGLKFGIKENGDYLYYVPIKRKMIFNIVGRHT